MARLGVRVGIYSLYLTTMLKPAALRLRAQLWTIANNKGQVPSLPAEGRTSLELAPDSNRDFFAAIGFLPLGNHAIRADMVERLAAMGRQAVRDSREAHHRLQTERRASEQAARLAKTEINEWMIVAAALGEPIGAAEPAAPAAPAPAEPTPAVAMEPENETIEVSSPVCYVDSPELRAGEPSSESPVQAPGAAPANDAPAHGSASSEAAAAPAAAEKLPAEPVRPTIKLKPPKKIELPLLPPGQFRAAAEMLSLVGCSEPAIAPVLRALGYRVHLPSDETGPLHSFSLPPRYPREERRERGGERRGRDRRSHQAGEAAVHGPRRHDGAASQPADGAQQRQQRDRDQNRRGPERHEQAPQQPAGREHAPPQAMDRAKRPPEGQSQKPPRDRDQRFDKRGRRDAAGPAVRLVASTEKKGGPPAGDSPFAKLLELKFGNKK
jgi:ATP-dependent RNA helicase SUPV3L1/SUV3